MGLRNAVNPRIGYGMKYLEWDACVSCGLDLWKWVEDGYPDEFKYQVIAFHNMRTLVRAHTEDARSSAIKPKKR